MPLLKNPLIIALDVDSEDEAFQKLNPIIDLVGAVKIGPRLAYRYGANFISKIAEKVPVFVDNKYFDIPSTMEAAVQASFDAGATLVTVHAMAGTEALQLLARLEKKLNQIRPFKILAVTILTSWQQSTFPENFQNWSIDEHVKALAEMVFKSGLTGLVCSGHELKLVSEKDFFTVVPGIRLIDHLSQPVNTQDQKRVMSPQQALKSGAKALVIGRPILLSENSRQTVNDILESFYK